jgi:parvulin-like peptidyl-prolyl isomerase
MDGTNPARAASASNSRSTRWGLAIVGLLVVGFSLVFRYYQGAPAASARGPNSAKNPAAATPIADAEQTADDASASQVAAVVNGQQISRNELADQCLKIFGADVLSNLIHKQLIVQQCKAQNVTITRGEVDQEVDRIATRFGLSTDRWLVMLKEERGVNPSVYAKDIIWPTLALRKLATNVEVTQAELLQAHEAKYGPAVRARLIACNTLEKARSVHAAAMADPEEFGTLAKEQSDDPNSASAKGLIQPIRKHIADKNIERVAFSMLPGQISEVIPVGQQYIILKCEQQLPASNVPLKQVAAELDREIREGKERQAANDVFKQMQDKAVIERYFGDPRQAEKAPGIAAVVNGRKITLRELGEACIERHGEGVLDGMITHRMLEQECKKARVEVTDADIDAEIARAAAAVPSMDGSGNPPTVEEWLDVVTRQQGVSIETYIHDAVWPSVALKKLVGGQVEVTDDDMQKGFEANYGPRVNCLAIVLNNQRRAQEVWEKARANGSAEYFGDLAEQYSVEESSRMLRGEVPPIQKHGGQPMLEEEAFKLKPGELSGLIHMGEHTIILHCLGRTRPTEVKFSEVRDLIHDDLHEKKLRLAMSDRLEEITASAQVDNILTGTVRSPRKVAGNQVVPAGAIDDGSVRVSDQPGSTVPSTARRAQRPAANQPRPR